MTDFIHLPGIGNSGDIHWQSLWEAADPAIRRFSPASWDQPDLADWIAALEQSVRETEAPPILVAHSLACLLVAHWSAVTSLPIAGAFLVAVPDPSSQAFPAQTAGFGMVPQERFRFPSLIVASTDDPYGSMSYVETRAEQWGSELVVIGAAGHINGQSGLGGWPKGRALLKTFENRISSENA
ncbi:alpha/beta hydrolase [Neorhizobium galegae]|uniref:RBBP9/YdeN family alpha/beta hydrolase n=1 Tax=Neorhizobium galegae TaxID=399 RepID=UPI000620F3C4|nr:alpha/beta hydrolase [Neorhizobium galegae]CDZ30303.1 Putative esterase of the alpha/beta hydrolase fold containing protein [Neorhizobium galegae bv. officinalis]KAA9386352.1 serine hydrolase family protein [Neorhizobium galegae]KAB1112889.1 serine hydrolase family protein [Neorhizobium galegae]MCM2501387.1 alpha/beta hydrolase [Neorhizobium galegae]MCQ1764568.1 alpha/beta hydrolase [Neorhizobium galegae]